MGRTDGADDKATPANDDGDGELLASNAVRVLRGIKVTQQCPNPAVSVYGRAIARYRRQPDTNVNDEANNK